MVCSSTNIDRLAGICSVIPKGRYCICDDYQLSVIEYIRDYAGDKSSLYKFGKALYYRDNLDEKMEERGFCMFIRCGNNRHKEVMEKFKIKNPVVIYSMWNGYLEKDNIREFLDGYKRLDMHTSGHADTDAIKMVADVTMPDMVIPMHTEVPEAFLKLVEDRKVVLAKDKEIINLEGKKMGRTISDTFVRDLESGVLSKLTEAVKENKKLIMCFRDDYMNVYYKSHSVFKIEEQKTQYKISFNLGHARYLSDFKTIQNELKEFNIVAKVSISKDKNGNNKYSYSAVFLIRKNVPKCFEFSPIIDLYTRYIDDFFTGGLRKDKFEGVERKTNSLREKRHQQCLYSKHLDSTKEILFYDMELSLPKPKDDSDEMKLIIDETDAKKHITGAPDCLAVRMKNGTVSKIVLVEVKSTRDACTGEHGIEKHGRDFGDIIKCSYYRNFIAESMKETLDLYTRYGLCDKINIPDKIGEKEEDFEVLYFFTHEDVIRWTKESKEDSKNNKKKYNELYSQNPQMFIDYSDTMKELLGKDYD